MRFALCVCTLTFACDVSLETDNKVRSTRSYRGVTHPGRTSDCSGAWSFREAPRPHAPTKSYVQSSASFGPWTLDVGFRLIHGSRSRHRSSKPNLQEPGGKARGSTPPRA